MSKFDTLIQKSLIFANEIDNFEPFADALIEAVKKEITEPLINLMGGLNASIKICDAIDLAYSKLKEGKQ
jgi:hypothetical protein